MTPQQIWEGLTDAQRRAVLAFFGPGKAMAEHLVEAVELREAGLSVGWSTLTALGREVAEYGRKL